MCARVRASACTQDYTKHAHGIFLHQEGVVRSIEEAQADQGFANVTESAIELLLNDRKVPLPLATGQVESDRKLELSMAAMGDIRKDWTDLEAIKALHRCFLLENPDTYGHLPIDTSIITEVVNASEAKAIQEFADQIQTTKAKKLIKQYVRDAGLKKYFKVSAKSQAKRPKPKATPRWVQAKHGSQCAAATAHVLEHFPASCKLFADEDDGRWRVMSEFNDRTSISWTRRGFAVAAAETIHVAWAYHMDAHPRDYPAFDLTDLARQFNSELAEEAT